MAVPKGLEPTTSTNSTTTDAAGHITSSAVYIFNTPCDLSQLRDVNLEGATLHSMSVVDVQKLKDLKLDNAKLIFNNGEQSILLAKARHANKSLATNRTAPPPPPRNPPAAPKKTRLSRGQKKALAAERVAESSRATSTVTVYPRSYLRDEDLKAAMHSSFDSVENAIHPDRISVVDHGVRNDGYDLEPGELREDAVVIKAEPESDDGRMLDFTLTQDTLDGNAARSPQFSRGTSISSNPNV